MKKTLYVVYEYRNNTCIKSSNCRFTELLGELTKLATVEGIELETVELKLFWRTEVE